MSSHPALIEALKEGVYRFGTGSGASPLISGFTSYHASLEKKLAEITKQESVLLFPSGYMANLAWMRALLSKEIVFIDRLCHASMMDGLLLSKANFRRYPHNDLSALERLLVAFRKKHGPYYSNRKCFVVTEGIFSMQGDQSPLKQLANLCKEHEAFLIVDDAHGFGVLGDRGQGSASYFGVEAELFLLIATFGKALGLSGAFLAGSQKTVDRVIQTGRTYTYSTALAPAVAFAAEQAIGIVQKESWRKEKLFSLINYFMEKRSDFRRVEEKHRTPIQPVVLGDEDKTLAMSATLLKQGFFVPSILPPTVPAGEAMLRVSLTTDHTLSEIDSLCALLEEVI